MHMFLKDGDGIISRQILISKQALKLPKFFLTSRDDIHGGVEILTSELVCSKSRAVIHHCNFNVNHTFIIGGRTSTGK